MKEYVSIDIESDIEATSMFDIFKQLLPEYDWRSGDSDMQGPYLSGKNIDDVRIKIWLGEKPFEMSISFQNSWLNNQDRDNNMENALSRIIQDFIPNFGRVVKTDI